MMLAAAGAGMAAILAALAARDLIAPAVSRAGHPRTLPRLLPAIGALGIVRRLRPPHDLTARLAAAGDPGGLRPRDWVALKACGAVVTSLPALLVAVGDRTRLGVLLALAAPAAGFVLPELWLGRAIRMRADAAARDLPDMLDLLRVAVEGGVAPIRAMGDVAGQFAGPLAAEWRRVAVGVTLGEPREVALTRLRDRLPAEGVTAFVDAFGRAQRHGLPLAPTLMTHAARARETRRRRTRERAARAGPKMQLVVALVLVPSMLLIVAALLLSELEPGLGLGG